MVKTSGKIRFKSQSKNTATKSASDENQGELESVKTGKTLLETHGKNGLKLAKHCSNKKAKDISSNN